MSGRHGPSEAERFLPSCPSSFAACTSNPRPTLSQSSTFKASVVDLQCLLNQKDAAGLVVDGYFGPNTKSAVQKWQQKKGCLTVDGIVGPNTWTTLCDAWAANQVQPSVSCGSSLPSSTYTARVSQASWNSGGKSYKTLAYDAGAAKNVHPALLLAHMVWESGMGLNNKCTASGKSALTGCTWYPSCAANCACTGTAVQSDQEQVMCTGCGDWKAYMEANTGISFGIGAYTKCSSEKSVPEKMWRCILCVYQGNYSKDITNTGGKFFTRDGTCAYADNMLAEYCKWKAYLTKYP